MVTSAHGTIKPAQLGAVLLAPLLLGSQAAAAAPQQPKASTITHSGAALYKGELALRTLVNGYVVSIEGESGDLTFVFRTESPVEELEADESEGSVAHSARYLEVELPSTGLLLRLGMAPETELPPAAQGLEVARDMPALSPEARERAAKRGAGRVLEITDGFEVARLSTPAGVRVAELAAQSSRELRDRGARAQLDAASAFPGDWIFYPSPDPGPNGGSSCTAGGSGAVQCSRSCSSGESCTITCRGNFYACCYCYLGYPICLCLYET